MELRPVKTKSKQDYPIFDDYWKNRRHYVKEAALCAGIVLGAGLLSSCDEQKNQVGGDIVQPQPPVNQSQGGNTATSGGAPSEEPVKLGGKMVAPNPPADGSKEAPVALPGSMPVPKQVTPAGKDETPQVDGRMVAPKMPEKEDKAPVEEKAQVEPKDSKETPKVELPVPVEGHIMGIMEMPRAPEKK